MSPRVFLIRHAETAWSLNGRHTGLTDVPLTPEGRAAATRLARTMASATFSLVLASPLVRARDTCELAGFAGQMTIESDLVEWNYGDYEGLTSSEIESRAPGWRLFTDGCPGGESPEEIGARVDRVVARIRTAAGDVALFAHGHVLRVLAARWIGLPVASGARFLFDTGAVSILGEYRGLPAVERWNLDFSALAAPAAART
jgi:probable phosphoglycerate mutase